jgi:hypothetical protein
MKTMVFVFYCLYSGHSPPVLYAAIKAFIFL